MNTYARLLETRPCAWCQTGVVKITTQQRQEERKKRRFCSLACSRKASGITHGEAWGRKMQAASRAAVKAKALREAEQMLQRHAPDVAARLIRDRGYKAGWKAGYASGLAIGRAEVERDYKRAEIARQKGFAA